MAPVTRGASLQPDAENPTPGDATPRASVPPRDDGTPGPSDDGGDNTQENEIIAALRNLSARLESLTAHTKKVEMGVKGLYTMHEGLTQRVESIETGEAQGTIGVSRGNKRGINDISGGAEEFGRTPARGQFGEHPSLDDRYGHLEAKVRDAALACHLTPAQLHLLIPPTSRFHQGLDDGSDIRLVADEDGTFTFKNTAKNDPKTVVSKFVTNIPGPLAFLCAWTHYTGLVAHGLGANSPDEIQLVWISMMWYAEHIIFLAGSHTWESVCRYHVAFQNQRCQKSFHSSLWYQAVDQDKLGMLDAKGRAAPAANTRTKGNQHRTPARDKRDVSSEICLQYNYWKCTEPCKNGRLHQCSVCTGPHRKSECKGKMKA